MGRIQVLEGHRASGLSFLFLAGCPPPSGQVCEKVLGERECQQMGVGVIDNLILQVASTCSFCIPFIRTKSAPCSGEGSTRDGGVPGAGAPWECQADSSSGPRRAFCSGACELYWKDGGRRIF